MASFNRLSYYSVMGEEDPELEEGREDEGGGDERTPLDRTIDRIGMGWYQWTLLSLCGFGWMADNMWIQAVAIALPRIQRHFEVRDSVIGTLSSSMFAGMMFGAVGWGTCSDLMGRTTAFNATLFLTAFFGIFASFAPTFIWLCISLFFLGSAVGGSMPTDGTLLLEHMPNGKQYLVTALSVFFSFGSVLAAFVGLIVIPGHSCPPAPAACDVDAQNQGWKYLLSTLGAITMAMFIARIVFFRLHESPRYLVHAGRPQEALESLQMISRFNGDELNLGLEDVRDSVYAPLITDEPANMNNHDLHDPPSKHPQHDSITDTPHDPSALVFDADAHAGETRDSRGNSEERAPMAFANSRDLLRASPESESKSYDATGESNVALEGHHFHTPQVSQISRTSTPAGSLRGRPESLLHTDAEAEDKPPLSREPSIAASRPVSGLFADDVGVDAETAYPRPRPRLSGRGSRRFSATSSVYEPRPNIYWKLPRWLRKPLWAWLDRIAMVLVPEWVHTTLLVWAAWFAMSLAYTMFNVYLPKLLEGRGAQLEADLGSASPKSLDASLWDVVIYALGGCPGAVLGAYLIEGPLGRRLSLAGSTFVTAFFCIIFVIVEQSWAVRASTVGISLSATAMWAVLYGWTPEIFGTKVRGSACGIASALSRIGGMIAPMLGGMLLAINQSIPVYVSIIVFAIAGFCVLLIREQPREHGGGRVIVH
ncbi:MFS general substrate transporter [Rhodofomes roseus]|uniref:MFS general substrate transporter n=1 Tax=Rhodofomes roseus TaxID=34475 RepID=A0ABQ8KSC2_9APHY|nr:MFS general substrate transporter [Rhodofomes roseus]KAH9841485.1 MFS general substrate transporter [Rhodofomes roseus]